MEEKNKTEKISMIQNPTGSSTAIPIIVFINVIIYSLWLLNVKMEENFLISWESLSSGRPWTLITSVFSHQMFWHLFLNMYTLGSFGEVIEEALGTWRFVSFYLLAGMVGSLFHAFASLHLLNKPELSALGASGAISGVLLYFSLSFPKEKIFLLGLIPIPAVWGVFCLIALDIWGLIRQTQGDGLPIGHGAHLGGAMTGIVFFLLTRFHQIIGARLYRWHQW